MPIIKPLLVALLLINSARSQQNNVSIIIIGAGSSGIAAATKLIKNNFTNIQILEAEDRIGGRIHSVRFGDAFVDLGAEFCHGESGNVVFSMVKDLKLLMTPKPEYELYFSETGDDIGIDVSESLFDLAHSIQHRRELNGSECDICGDIVSEGECLDRNFLEMLNCSRDNLRPILELSYDWLRSYKSCTESCFNLNDVSLISNYRECKGDQMLQWCGHGFKTILEVMMQTHPNQKNVEPLLMDIKLNKTVSKIILGEDGSVSVRTEDGEEFWGEHVIFTPSLGVLKDKHHDLFSPKLSSDKLQAIDRIGYGAIIKVALYFDYMWWLIHGSRIWGCIWSSQHNEELKLENLLWVKQFTAFTAAPKNLKVLIAWFAGESVKEIEYLTDHELLRGIRFILSKCYFRYMGIDMPKRILRSKWLRNPHFKGTYSYESMKGLGYPEVRSELGSPVVSEEGVPRLLFAGEATHPTMFATVHGAIESGYREAERLIQLYVSEDN
ncbi:spermine oxidase-like [Anthonomus grandis grandis]|uniref:spermine oxidase-like n=1 Tax=Anthonomus grandis grandis TaxID=2921223 RepID=UPI002165A761|nr:spermine oxidase-like [Anthonomus grandis grandis]